MTMILIAKFLVNTPFIGQLYKLVGPYKIRL